MAKTISVLGCGWLGLPFAKAFANMGWTICGSTTSPEKIKHLESFGIIPFIINLNKNESLQNKQFFSSEYLLINIPPGKTLRHKDAYLPLINTLEASSIKKVILVSSTSVYQANNRIAEEISTQTIAQGVSPILDIEREFQKASFKTTIVRFGGLVGGTRYPGRFFKADSIVKGAQHPVNLIHLDDCILILKAIIEQECWDEIFNGVADTHPPKKEFYTLAAQLANFPSPHFLEDDSSYKIITNNKIKKLLGLQFKHPDLLTMLKNKTLWGET